MIILPHHTKKLKKLSGKTTHLDYIVDVAVLLAPLSLLPQLLRIWQSGDTSGVSIVTWLMTLIITIPLIAYDVKHSVLKLAFMHSSIVVICLGIVVRLAL
jgi:uncharacterized protein with PQ loop repeat